MVAVPVTLSESRCERSEVAAKEIEEENAEKRAAKWSEGRHNFHKEPEVPVRAALADNERAGIVC
jgi:hypothetical protein